MLILDIVLALALVMAAFSTVSSGLTELVLRLWPTRAGHLRSTMRNFIAEVLLPNYIEVKGGGYVFSVEDEKAVSDNVLYQLTKNPNHKPAESPGLLSMPFVTRQYIDELSTEAFIERLAKSVIGKAFALEADDARAKRISAISLSYERFMAASAELYRKTANTVAIGVAIAFAFGSNIQFLEIVDHLRGNPEAIAEVIASDDQLLNTLDPDDDYEAKVQALSGTIDDLPLPLGWGGVSGAPVPVWQQPEESTDGTKFWFRWLIEVLASGLLIGLGAPFWYRAVKNISQVRFIAGSLVRTSPESVGEPSQPNHSENIEERATNQTRLFDALSDNTPPPLVDDAPPPAG